MGLNLLLLELALVAGKNDFLLSVAIESPLRSTLLESLVTVLVDCRPIADAELDVSDALGKGFDVLFARFVPWPQVHIHLDAGRNLDAADVDEDDIFVSDLDHFRSELEVTDIKCVEVERCYIIYITLLGKIDVCHCDNVLKMVND